MENTALNNKPVTEPIEEKNKVPYWSQRVASGVIDVGLLLFLLFIFVSIFRITPLGDVMNNYEKEMVYITKDYAIKPLIDGSDETHSYKVYITDENKEEYKDYYQFDDEEGKIYVLKSNETEDVELRQKLDEALQNALKKDKKYEAASFNYRLVNYGIEMISVTISEAILILLIPLLNKKRVTIGQYLAGLRCINSKYDSPARWYKIVIRFFWVLIFEVALPCLSIVSLYAIIFTPMILYVISLFNEKKRTLRDYVSTTRFIDDKSYEPVTGPIKKD